MVGKACPAVRRSLIRRGSKILRVISVLDVGVSAERFLRRRDMQRVYRNNDQQLPEEPQMP